jgi:hypothetical protein
LPIKSATYETTAQDFGGWEDGWEEPGKIAQPKTGSRHRHPCRRAPWRSVMGVPGQRSQAARKITAISFYPILSASRFSAGAAGFFVLIQSRECPER